MFHPGCRDTQNVSCVFIDALLQIQDFFIPGSLGKLLGFFVSFLLKEAALVSSSFLT